MFFTGPEKQAVMKESRARSRREGHLLAFVSRSPWLELVIS